MADYRRVPNKIIYPHFDLVQIKRDGEWRDIGTVPSNLPMQHFIERYENKQTTYYTTDGRGNIVNDR